MDRFFEHYNHIDPPPRIGEDVTSEARQFLEDLRSEGSRATETDLFYRLAEKHGFVVAYEVVYGNVPEQMEIARQKIKEGRGWRIASILSGYSESWLRVVLDKEKHNEKIARDRQRHKDKREHRLAVMREWYRKNRDKKLAYEAERRKKK